MTGELFLGGFKIFGDAATINLTHFLYQICLTGKSDENDCLYVQNTEGH